MGAGVAAFAVGLSRRGVPLRRPSVDVHRHAAGRDRHRPDQRAAPAKPYIDAIQAVTKAPIKYVIYSHSHFDHIAGGKPFKELGAVFVAHRNRIVQQGRY
jgi:glyoxylase-like metal-dependent hydrolase (beta-lactamase superfamily II)